MPFDLSEVVSDPEMAEPFTIQRTTGNFGEGGWIAGPLQQIPAFGVVSIASAKEIASVPEADQVHEMRSFWTTQQMYVTTANGNQTSDVLLYNGQQYRILKQPDYGNHGYYKALAARMVGD